MIMLKKRIEYLIAISSSLILLEIGFFYALVWYWSGFEWSPLGYETCGMEFIAILLLTYPAFVLGLLIRLGLLFPLEIPALCVVSAFDPVRYCFLCLCQIS